MSEYKYARLLKPDEISCRVLKVSEYRDGTFGANVALYKDARVDMCLLDETYGSMNWQRHHFELDGKLFCTIEVWDKDKGQWVGKDDVGVESNMDAVKGEASDSFKRSGTNWGIGRELYTAPDIFIRLSEEEVEKYNGKPRTTYKFGLFVKDIGCNSKNTIIRLVLVDKKGNTRFLLNGKNDEPTAGEVEKSKETDSPTKGTPVEKAKIPKPVEKEPVKIGLTIDPIEYNRRREDLKGLMQTYGKTNEDYSAVAGDRDIKTMTTQEFDIFKKELTNKWLVAK